MQVQVYSTKLTCILKVLEFVNKKDDRVKSFVSFLISKGAVFNQILYLPKKETKEYI